MVQDQRSFAARPPFPNVVIRPAFSSKARDGDMTRVPRPDGHSSPSDQGKHLVASATRASVPWHLAEAANMELPSDAAMLRLVLFPAPRAGLDWAALTRAARPLADLTLMGLVAPVATIYAARAAK